MPNYRKVYKSDHLGVIDLEELVEQNKPLIFTIKEVKQETTLVAGTRGTFNIAYFIEPIKPLVLNATNAKVIRGFSSGKSVDTDNWKNIPIELYIDQNVKMKGEIVGGVRIKPLQPKIVKEKPFFTKANFEKALEAKATKEQIEKVYQLTEEIWNQYSKELANGTNKEKENLPPVK